MLVIVGESGAGKSSVVKHFVNSLGFRVIVPYTTRKPREGEVNGVDYHFVSDVSFEKMRGEQFFAEAGVYNGWYYGSAKEDYINSRMKIAVLTPHGLRQVRKSGISVCVVYLKVPRRNRLIKLLQRGDSIEKAYRRNLSDVGQFDGVEDEIDLVIENDGYRKSIEEIANEIKAFYYNIKPIFNQQRKKVRLHDKERNGVRLLSSRSLRGEWKRGKALRSSAKYQK